MKKHATASRGQNFRDTKRGRKSVIANRERRNIARAMQRWEGVKSILTLIARGASVDVSAAGVTHTTTAFKL